MAVTIAGSAHRRPWLLLAPSLVTIGLLLAIPLIFIVVYSFWLRAANGANITGLHLDNWETVLGGDFYWLILWQTIRIALISTVVCILVGYIPAYFIARSQTRFKTLLILLLMLPFWISYIIRTMSWINVLGATGAVNKLLMWLGIIHTPLPLLYNVASVIVGLVNYLLPFMILNVYVSLSGIDTSLASAARTLGASPWQAFTQVTLPLSLPGVAAGSLLCFVLGAGIYITPQILGGPHDIMFANLIYNEIITRLNWPFGSVLSLILLLVLGSVVVLYGRLIGLKQLYKSFG
jgi:spermidine/putrescine transport system permease protein